MHAQYFEGILQLRNPTDEIVDFILDAIEKKGVTIAKEKKVGDGVDLYLSDQHFLQVLGKNLVQTFGGEMKVSATLHTRNHQTSKELYRVSVLFRHYPVRVGDTITVKDETYKVQKIGSKITGKNLKTGKRTFIDFKDLK